jgi:hypothetical protein
VRSKRIGLADIEPRNAGQQQEQSQAAPAFMLEVKFSQQAFRSALLLALARSRFQQLPSSPASKDMLRECSTTE